MDECAYCYLCERPVAGIRRKVVCPECVGKARRLGVLDEMMSLVARIAVSEEPR